MLFLSEIIVSLMNGCLFDYEYVGKISLGTVLSFFTGATEVPPLGSNCFNLCNRVDSTNYVHEQHSI